MAQLSFAYDTFVFGYYFNGLGVPSWFEYFETDILYTLRVLVAWVVIKQLWDWIGNYWIAVFIGAELTFVFDYFIFKHLFV
jgi:hypothetical protein